MAIELKPGQIWRHKATGAEYQRGTYVDVNGKPTTPFWRRGRGWMIPGSPMDFSREQFFDEFELIQEENN